jgi:hypothetical protein
MAKIALVCKDFSESTQTLAMSLYNQKQEVLVITKKNLTSIKTYPFPVLAYFDKWSLLEGLRFLPQFLHYHFDVVHFIFDSPKVKITAAHLVLSSLQEALPYRCNVASFFFPFGKFRSASLFLFLRQLSAATVSTRQQLLYFNRYRKWMKTPDTSVIPPLKNYQINLSDVQSSDIIDVKKLVENTRPYLILPFDPSEDLKQKLKGHLLDYSFIVLAKRPKKSKTGFYFMGSNLSSVEETYLYLNAQAVWIAGFDLSVGELVKFRQLSQLTVSPLMVDSVQQALLHGLVADQRTGWVLNSDLSDLEQAFANIPNLKIELKNLDNQLNVDLFDSSVNELNRLYQKSLSIGTLRN